MAVFVLPDLAHDFVGEYHSKLLEALTFLKDNQDSVGAASVVWLADAAGNFNATNVEDAFAEMVGKLQTHIDDGNKHPTRPDQVGAAPASHVGQGGTGAHPVASANGGAGFMSGSDKAKLDQLGFEAGSMTAPEILTALKSVDGAGSGLDADTLDGLDPTAFTPIAHVGSGGAQHANATTGTAGFMSSADKIKLNGIEDGAQTQNANEVPIQDTADNFVATNVEDALAEEATARKQHAQSGGNAHPAVNTTTAGFMTAADKVKLNGIENGATGDQTAAEILTALEGVDGDGSGLDADMLDGHHATDFLTTSYSPPVYYKAFRAGSVAAPITGSIPDIVMESRTLIKIRAHLETPATVNTTINIVRTNLAGTVTNPLTSITINANQKDAVASSLSFPLADGDTLRFDVASGGTNGQNLTVVCKAT